MLQKNDQSPKACEIMNILYRCPVDEMPDLSSVKRSRGANLMKKVTKDDKDTGDRFNKNTLPTNFNIL
jgi:hypothetical protein